MLSAAIYNMFVHDTNENNKYFAAIWLNALPNMCTTPYAEKINENASLIVVQNWPTSDW